MDHFVCATGRKRGVVSPVHVQCGGCKRSEAHQTPHQNHRCREYQCKDLDSSVGQGDPMTMLLCGCSSKLIQASTAEALRPMTAGNIHRAGWLSAAAAMPKMHWDRAGRRGGCKGSSPVWNSNCCLTWPVRPSQMMAVLSTEPDSSRSPFLFHFSEKMGPL